MGYTLCSFSMQFNLLDKMITVSFIKAHLVAREVPGAVRNSLGEILVYKQTEIFLAAP